MPATPEIDMPRYDPSETDDRGPAEPFSGSVRADTLTCGDCGAANQVTRKFCAGCGTSLQDPCPHCGATCSAGERFCGSCGVNLVAAIQHDLEQFEANLAAVEQLRSQDRFEDAMTLLGPMAKTAHPRLARHAARAKQIIKQIIAQRERRRTAAEAACQEGERLLGEHQYDLAVRVLESIGEPLRDEKFRKILAEALAGQEEVVRLGRRVRDSLKVGRPTEALAMLDRLLELRPDHARARQLADQLLERCCLAAEKYLTEGRYEEALRLLDEVPSSLRTPAISGGLSRFSFDENGTVPFGSADRYERAAEWACLGHHLRTAPEIDEPLVAMAQRLRKLAPDDARSAKLVDELQRRWTRATERGLLAPPPWAAPPQQTALEFPVDRAAGPRRIAMAEGLDRRLLAANPGRFAVACGLALQGLDKAHVGINLLPADYHGHLGAIAQKLLKRPATAAWGIDLGSSSLKAVRLSWDIKQQTAIMDAAVCLEYRKPLGQAADADQRKALVDEALAELAGQQRLKGARIGLGLPGRIAILRQFPMPSGDPAKLSAMVRHEAPLQMPLPLAEMVWGYQALVPPAAHQLLPSPLVGEGQGVRAQSRPSTVAGEAPTSGYPGVRAKRDQDTRNDSAASKKTGPSTIPVLFCGARRELVVQHAQALADRGIRVDFAQSECLALHNYWRYEEAADPAADSAAAEDSRPVALLDIGGESGSLVVSSPHGVWVRQMGFGGHLVTRALVKGLNLTLAQAEQLKRNPATAPSIHKFCQTIGPVLQDLLHEIEFCLKAFAKSEQYEPIERMIGLGGEFQLQGLLRRLRTGQ
ncbi:MAG: pilus assembly protein PilM [Thermoguttaceae bacterium]